MLGAERDSSAGVTLFDIEIAMASLNTLAMLMGATVIMIGHFFASTSSVITSGRDMG